MTVFINKKETQLADKTDIPAMLQLSGIENIKGIAIAINNEVIPKNNWSDYLLKDQDKITIITATAGG